MKTREDRYWDTYNAALSRLSPLLPRAEDADLVHAMVHEECVRYAERAHGPLAAIRNRHWDGDDPRVQLRRDVDALVKAAREAVEMLDLEASNDASELREALKPFEDKP